ncbi:ADP-ribosylation factor [Mycena floridula]|nr:ADP-ribosylation factor [Mycena floridula]
MGATFSGLVSNFTSRESRIIMVGLDGAGKSAILYRLKTGELVTTVPTIGFNVETVKHRNISFTIWDVCGQEKARALWRSYYRYAEGFFIVVDSNDRGRITEARDNIQELLKAPEFDTSLILFLAHKSDLPDAMDSAELIEKLSLNDLRQKHWHVQTTSAMTGEGLQLGLNWMAQKINQNPRKPQNSI